MTKDKTKKISLKKEKQTIKLGQINLQLMKSYF
jgi:hypothetical protein